MTRRLTKHEKRMVDKYTYLVKSAWAQRCVLRIGNQSFHLGPWDYAVEAKWHQKMLGIALANLVDMETKTKK